MEKVFRPDYTLEDEDDENGKDERRREEEAV